MKSNNTCTLTDIKGYRNIEVEVNKNNKVEDYVEFRVKDENGNWVKSYVKIKELYALIFMLVGKEEQEVLMPIRQTDVRTYIRQHRIKLKKNMKKGEIVVANCRISVPVLVEENIKAFMGKKYKTKSNILIPR